MYYDVRLLPKENIPPHDQQGDFLPMTVLIHSRSPFDENRVTAIERLTPSDRWCSLPPHLVVHDQ